MHRKNKQSLQIEARAKNQFLNLLAVGHVAGFFNLTYVEELFTV